MKSAVQERRRFSRQELPERVSINLLEPATPGPVRHVNYSEGGLCLRLDRALEVRSFVRMQLTPDDAARRTMEVTGRVAWVMQRMDLRSRSPLFDIGVEFADALPRLQQALGERTAGGRAGKLLDPASLGGRTFVPHIEKKSAAHGRWHLVVAVEGAPCFSGHYDSERAALQAWSKFKSSQARAQAKRGRAS